MVLCNVCFLKDLTTITHLVYLLVYELTDFGLTASLRGVSSMDLRHSFYSWLSFSVLLNLVSFHTLGKNDIFGECTSCSEMESVQSS